MKQWLAHTTVAAVVQNGNEFLMVREQPDGKDDVYNQPAGHLEDNETLLNAVIRETLEETGHHIQPVYLIGVYHWKSPNDGTTFIRYAYACELVSTDILDDIDPDIIGVHWVSADDILQQKIPVRSPLVQRCLQDYLDGQCFPLEIVNHLTDSTE